MSWFTVLRLLLYRSVLELFSKSFKVFHCSVINVRCCYFQQLVYFIISSSRCQQLFYFSLLSLKRYNSDILSCLSLFVNNFFHHHDHQPSLSFLPVPVSVSSSVPCTVASRVSLDIISRRQPKVNKNFTFYLQKYKHHKILFPGCLQTTIQS